MRIAATRIVVSMGIALAVLAAPGCGRWGGWQPTGGGEVLPAPELVSVVHVAGRLGMQMDTSSASNATFGDGTNSVTVFADPGGQAYVNGRPVGQPGGIRSVGGALYVPQTLEAEIRRHLRRPAPVYTPPPPVRPSRVSGIVVIDPGHGGKDPGAIARSGLHEKVVNLSVARSVASLLRQRGVQVKMTREDDRFIELNDRADIANRLGADLYVSIHADSASNRAACGFTIYVARSASGNSLKLAKAVEHRMGKCGALARTTRRADYRVLVRTACPAVLVELGFLSNQGESAKLADPRYRQRLASAVADGIVDYLKAR